jgi:hypothetical protein
MMVMRRNYREERRERRQKNNEQRGRLTDICDGIGVTNE